MKKITLNADEYFLEAAHKYAAVENTTLNAKFRQWLEDYTQRQRQRLADRAVATIRELQGKISTDSYKFNRDEMNEH